MKIEQVLYRRTLEGYNEYYSNGLSKDQAHRVNALMNMVASDISDMGSTTNSPFMLYNFAEMHKFCLATFKKEFSRGSSNSANHALLIDESEYEKLIRDPEQLWGFTNKNFLSRRLNEREEMFTLEKLDISENYGLDKDSIFKEYGLNNDEYLKFLNAIYTSLYRNKEYSFGIRIDNSKNANKVMRHFGYLIMSMLPYELRDKISFCSRSVPDDAKITVQILQEKDPEKTDITYDISKCECLVNNANIEIIDFYLTDLLSVSNDALKDYFDMFLDFKSKINISKDSEEEYIILKLWKLSEDPSLFASETAEAQLTFIRDVFSLPAANANIINSIVAQLLRFVDSKHCIEAFNINFELYNKLDSENESDVNIIARIEDNLLSNYDSATPEEKEQLFKSVFMFNEVHTNVYKILERFVEINKMKLDVSLVDEYIKLYEEFFGNELASSLYLKIVEVFKQCDISGKEKIWNQVYSSTDLDVRKLLVDGILSNEDEPFHKVIFNNLVTLFTEATDSQFKESCYTYITNVIHKEDDEFLMKILLDYNDVYEVEDSLWLEAYNSIKDYKRAAKNAKFLECLKDKYYKSSNPQICDLYLEHIDGMTLNESEDIINKYVQKAKTSEREDRLFNKVVDFLKRDKKKVSINVLKEMITAVKDEYVDELATYISTVYLSANSDDNNEIYNFMQIKNERLYNSTCLNKENLCSFDSYNSSKINERNEELLEDEKELVDLIEYLEKLKYNEESFAKIESIYHEYINQKLNIIQGDYERFTKCRELYNKLDSIKQTEFGAKYYSELKDAVQKSFWEESNINTFDYEHCDIYRLNSVMYDKQFKEHENHVLTENISELIDDYNVDWDKVYKMLLSRKEISSPSIRKQIIENFIKEYHNNGLSVSDDDYIAFTSVNKNSLEMDYSMLFDNLQKCGHLIDNEAIRNMRIFRYISINDKLLDKKIAQFKNYQSENPSYKEIIIGLLMEQFAFMILLVANNVLCNFVIKTSVKLKDMELLSLCNRAVYVVLIIAAAIASIVLMKQANKRSSDKYDKCVFGLLIINMMICIAAILLSVKVTNVLIWILVVIVNMVAMIILDIVFIRITGMPIKKEKKHGNDVDEQPKE